MTIKRVLPIVMILLTFAAQVAAEVFPVPAGWRVDGEVLEFDGENLWRHINGGADQFIACGFRLLTTAELVQGDLIVSVNVNDMATPLNAYGIYHLQRSDGMVPLSAGAASAATPPYQWLLLKDRFFVVVEPFEGDMTGEKGEQLLNAIADALPGDDTLPAELALLPERGKVAASERFTREAYLGLSELGHCLSADYLSGDDGYQIFTMILGQTGDGTKILAALPEKWQRREMGKLKVCLRTIPYKGTVGLALWDNRIVGVAGRPDAESTLEVLTRVCR
ncbi:MAG: hypothetical protein GY835_17030 [bacterium]|nr:hypothetical protein [bacterium]